RLFDILDLDIASAIDGGFHRCSILHPGGASEAAWLQMYLTLWWLTMRVNEMLPTDTNTSRYPRRSSSKSGLNAVVSFIRIRTMRTKNFSSRSAAAPRDRSLRLLPDPSAAR